MPNSYMNFGYDAFMHLIRTQCIFPLFKLHGWLNKFHFIWHEYYTNRASKCKEV